MTRCLIFASCAVLGLSACAAQPPKPQTVHLIRAVEAPEPVAVAQVQAAVAPAPEPAQVVVQANPVATTTYGVESDEPGVLGRIIEAPAQAGHVEIIMVSDPDEEVVAEVPVADVPVVNAVETETPVADVPVLDAVETEASVADAPVVDAVEEDAVEDSVAEVIVGSSKLIEEKSVSRNPDVYEQYVDPAADEPEEEEKSWVDRMWEKEPSAPFTEKGQEEALYEREVAHPISETSHIVNNEVVPITTALPVEDRDEISKGFSRLGRNYLIEQEERDLVSGQAPVALQKVASWEKTKNWKIEPGDSLVDLMQDWSLESGWQLVLETDKDWTFQAGTVLYGNYLEVTSELFRVMQNAKPSPPKGLAFTKNLVMVLSDDLGRAE